MGKIDVFQGKDNKDLVDKERTTLPNDEFLKDYGLLFHGTYYVLEHEDGEDLFLSDDKSTFLAYPGEEKAQRTSSTLFDIDSDTLLESRLSRVGNNYSIQLSLKEEEANRFYKKLFSKVAGLYDVLNIHGCDIDFLLDENLLPISAVYTAVLDVPVSILGTIYYFNGVKQTMETRYFQSESETFLEANERARVTVPEIEETTFSGYAFLPEVEKSIR